MERDIYEVVSSQQKMLSRLGKNQQNDTFPTQLVSDFENTVASAKKWIDNQRNVEAIYINYNNVLRDPYQESLRINHFLQGSLNINGMTSVVDENLKREGKKENLI